MLLLLAEHPLESIKYALLEMEQQRTWWMRLVTILLTFQTIRLPREQYSVTLALGPTIVLLAAQTWAHNLLLVVALMGLITLIHPYQEF